MAVNISYSLLQHKTNLVFLFSFLFILLGFYFHLFIYLHLFEDFPLILRRRQR